MKYMLLVYEKEAEWQKLPQAEQEKAFGAYMALSAELKAKGKHLAGHPLAPTASATTVRVRDSKVLSTDGPFAETREQLGGYYLIEADDLDEALAYAARVPAAYMGGSVEVRPVVDVPGD
jgi:hypothetical protein